MCTPWTYIRRGLHRQARITLPASLSLIVSAHLLPSCPPPDHYVRPALVLGFQK
ncbi:uncharacterized protein SCHCODRAFT_02617113 [Schizophyllum commune H4-8]|uniref:uncharacterized protein n=1 Tax=Schizophyllum commune (strain H4-8 / FGSC 9210) TaxID=578458 RepID=UPI00215F9B66|nr:uncharacterized protein SCHCODRAFT_02617113 [Schizophyllum commune H4-8]KAI5894492.1 hypothetical protein SCHCODRAFT_02617113 [Schizophyllum commune H4-8]